MGDGKTAKLFMHGRSQAVRLPKEYRLPGKEARVSRQGSRIILEPAARDPADVASVFSEIDRLVGGAPFLEPHPREDPPVKPDRRRFFDT